MAKAKNVTVNLQSGTDRTVYATWTWNKDHTENYRVVWYYKTGDGVKFNGSDSFTTSKQSVYNAPANANKVIFKVKPISKTHKVKKGNNTVETKYWTANWSTEKEYVFRANPPSVPPTPTVSIDGYNLTARVDNLNVNATHISFQIVKDDKTVIASPYVGIVNNSAVTVWTISHGSNYKVRCRAVRGDDVSGWSNYSSNAGTPPLSPGKITECRALSETAVYLNWNKVSNATSYEIQYTTVKSRFDTSTDVGSMTVEAAAGHGEITGLESGNEYFFRVRAVNNQGKSSWTSIASTIIGKEPGPPTTWSSTTTAITGEPVILYWVHNSEDGSSQTYAELELTIGGVKNTYTIKNSTDEDEKDRTSSYSVDTSSYTEGTKIEWRVRTRGIMPDFGDWSVQRSIDVYAPPTLDLTMTDVDGEAISILTAFPFYISGLAGPNTQMPIGYHLSIISNEVYEATDYMGNTKVVNEGEEVYSNFFDTSETLLVELSAGNIDLENNVRYTVLCTVSMDSGLTGEASLEFTVAWTDEEYEPDAEIGIDGGNLTALIRPYCQNEDGELIDNLMLSVYRREFDGTFTELIRNIDNTGDTYITDPHPALDYARYRVVAIDKLTGAVSFYDIPGYPVGESAVIIQWDEAWSTFDVNEEDDIGGTPWAGSMLRLPYNIDIADNPQKDVSLVKYIGRSYPVGYYGTQRGHDATWNVEIEKDDEETLYALRRLGRWMGDVYVREPSGSGYWANVTVAFSQKHKDLTIPVTLSITRVEGGA